MAEKSKARSQADAGIEKQVIEAVYPADILADPAFMKSSLEAKGAWFICLLHIWREKPETGQVSGTFTELGRLWGCDAQTAEQLIDELKNNKVCNVTKRHRFVTLVSRRVARRVKAKKEAAKRQKLSRENRVSQECHNDKGVLKGGPSFSSSFSSSRVKTPPTPLLEKSGVTAPKKTTLGDGSVGEFDWRTPGLWKLVVGQAPKAWQPGLRRRGKGLKKYTPDRVLAVILDVRHGNEQPGDADEAMGWIFLRLKNGSAPSDGNWENAKLMLRGLENNNGKRQTA